MTNLIILYLLMMFAFIIIGYAKSLQDTDDHLGKHRGRQDWNIWAVKRFGLYSLAALIWPVSIALFVLYVIGDLIYYILEDMYYLFKDTFFTKGGSE